MAAGIPVETYKSELPRPRIPAEGAVARPCTPLAHAMDGRDHRFKHHLRVPEHQREIEFAPTHPRRV